VLLVVGRNQDGNPDVRGALFGLGPEEALTWLAY
jgi:hypothetical protein